MIIRKVFKSRRLRNWRTTLWAACAAICYFYHDQPGLSHFAQTTVKVIGAVGMFLGGLAAVDAQQMDEAIDEGTKKYARDFRRR